MGKRIVIALGGNALGSTPYEQLALVTETAKPIVDLIEQGNEVVIAHGNGPQVGMINLGMATAAEAGAMSQGYIGYHLQNAIGNELAARGLQKDVATVVTQVLVDENDPAFQKPTKPVGAFYDKATAERIAAEKGYTMVEDAGRGYRQVVPSPKPVDVIEKNTVRALINGGCVVITVGGGGIPVVRRDGKLYGTPAVIDKDFASAKLAELVQADALVILTAVDRVCINWGKPDQKSRAEMTCCRRSGLPFRSPRPAGRPSSPRSHRPEPPSAARPVRSSISDIVCSLPGEQRACCMNPAAGPSAIWDNTYAGERHAGNETGKWKISQGRRSCAVGEGHAAPDTAPAGSAGQC